MELGLGDPAGGLHRGYSVLARMILWKVYMAFTVAETVLPMPGGMDLFDVLCHTFGPLATGGFSTKNASIGYYHYRLYRCGE